MVLADKPVAYPLTGPCAHPWETGLPPSSSARRNTSGRLKEKRPVRIRASVLGSGMHRDIEGTDIGERLSRQAYDMAGIGPEDIHLAELHDATSYGELHPTEAMGFCPIGEGGILAESGATTLGGRIPINTSGGLECRGHPIGASGFVAQIHEVVEQIRGEAGKRLLENTSIDLN